MERTEKKELRGFISFALALVMMFTMTCGMVYVDTAEVYATDPPTVPPTEAEVDGNCITFSSDEEFTIEEKNDGTCKWSSDGGHIYYSTDGAVWSDWNGGTVTSEAISSGKHELKFCGSSNSVIYNDKGSYKWWITTTAEGQSVECTGNIMTLLNYIDPDNAAMGDNCFVKMFDGNACLTKAPSLPALTLADNCYNSMFSDCTGLTAAPELPATTLAESCYQNMFSGCTSLAATPELPATTLATGCYTNMFYRCTSLVVAPTLPALTLSNNCYNSMFGGCTSLTAPPELPATTLAASCYKSMFSNCTSLAALTTLPATTLAESCYAHMFSGCSSLVITTGPSLTVVSIPWSIPDGPIAENWSKNIFSGTPNATLYPEIYRGTQYYYLTNIPLHPEPSSGSHHRTRTVKEEPIVTEEAILLTKYIDVHPEDYFYDAVCWADSKEITNGIEENLFGVGYDCTRAQLVTFLWRAAGCPVVNGIIAFDDVAMDEFYTEAVRWASNTGLVSGIGNGQFAPNAQVTRAQTVTILARYAGEAGQTMPAGTDSASQHFTDLEPGAYYVNAVAWAVANGVTSGTTETTFAPNDTCKREDIVTFLFRDLKR